MSKGNMDVTGKVMVEDLATRLREARCRIQPEMLQREVGQKIGRSAPCIGQWENGRAEPRLTDLVALANLYHVSIEWLLGIQTDASVLDNHVPLLDSVNIAAWDFSSAARFIQTAAHYKDKKAAAWTVTTDALKTVCQSGDTAIVENDTLPVLGGVYLVEPKDGGGPTLRRCEQDGVFIFTPDQTGFGLYREHQVKIIGRVREVIRRTIM